MRCIKLLTRLALAICFPIAVTSPVRSIPKQLEPTVEQIAVAKEAYTKLGADHIIETDRLNNQPIHAFRMPLATSDANLKGLPRVPFPFVLILDNSDITDAGLKELKNLKNLTGLQVSYTEVSDVGLKELKDFKNLTKLQLKPG